MHYMLENPLLVSIFIIPKHTTIYMKKITYIVIINKKDWFYLT